MSKHTIGYVVREGNVRGKGRYLDIINGVWVSRRPNACTLEIAKRQLAAFNDARLVRVTRTIWWSTQAMFNVGIIDPNDPSTWPKGPILASPSDPILASPGDWVDPSFYVAKGTNFRHARWHGVKYLRQSDVKAALRTSKPEQSPDQPEQPSKSEPPMGKLAKSETLMSKLESIIARARADAAAAAGASAQVDARTSSPTLQVRFLDERDSRVASAPRPATPGAAGLDLVAAWFDEGAADAAKGVDAWRLEPGCRVVAWMSYAVAVPDGYVGFVCPRSGLAARDGITVLNGPGVIDADYRGRLGAILVNLGQKAVMLKAGMRVAQLVIAPVATADVAVVPELSMTERNTGGLDSTGR